VQEIFEGWGCARETRGVEGGLLYERFLRGGVKEMGGGGGVSVTILRGKTQT
jgi:hypothetical protein